MADRITYRGVTFRRYPDAPGWSERAYYTPDGAARKRGVRRLHEEVYRDHHGEPPPGWHVHHADHDHLNNDPSNLVALDAAAHQEHHAAERRGVCTPAQAAALEAARVAAAAWHRSPEGRAWHAEHSRDLWTRREPVVHLCERCGAAYDTTAIHGANRFCSNRCKSAARRASGVDDEDRTCPECAGVFRVNRYSKARACSRACAGRASGRARTRVQPQG